MKKFLQRLWESEKGFTLIELIIVIVILAVISAIAVPNILSAVDNARKTTDVTNARMIANAAAMVKAKNDNIANPAGTYTFTANADPVGKDSAGNVAVANTDIDMFAKALATELNGGKIAPKYKGGDAAEATAFIMTIDDKGVIKINVNSTKKPMVFPTPDSAYDNK